jgi:hypothetical protein
VRNGRRLIKRGGLPIPATPQRNAHAETVKTRFCIETGRLAKRPPAVGGLDSRGPDWRFTEPAWGGSTLRHPRGFLPYFDATKTHRRKKILTFGEFIANAYNVWGSQDAREIVRRAVNAHWVEFHGKHRFIVC